MCIRDRSIDIPIEVANKRQVRIEQAQHLSQIAKLEIAQTAWQLRHQLAQTLSSLQYNQQQRTVLTQEKALREAIVGLYQKRLSLGEASNIELSNACLLYTSFFSVNARFKSDIHTIAIFSSALNRHKSHALFD